MSIGHYSIPPIIMELTTLMGHNSFLVRDDIEKKTYVPPSPTLIAKC